MKLNLFSCRSKDAHGDATRVAARCAFGFILVASFVLQSVAQAQVGVNVGFGLAPAMPQCPYNFGAAQGAQNGSDEITELRREQLELKRDLRDKKNSLREENTKQGKAHDAIEKVIQGRWSDPIFQHMDNGYNCCPAQGPPPVVALSGPPAGAPPAPTTETPRPPRKSVPGCVGKPDQECQGSQGSGGGRPAGGSNKGSGSDGGRPNPPPAPTREVGQLEPETSGRSPASFGAAVDSGQAVSSVNRAPAGGADQSQGPPPEAIPPTSGGPYTTPGYLEFQGSGPGLMGGPGPQCLAPPPPPYQDACNSPSGGGGGEPAQNCPNSPVPFGYPRFLAICRDGGTIAGQACSDKFYRNGDVSSGDVSTCVSALAAYRRSKKKIDQYTREIASIEKEIDDLGEAIGDARRSAREDAKLEASCPECAAAGRRGGGHGSFGGPSLAQTLVGGGFAAAALGLGFWANQQMNHNNAKEGYPGQSFLPAAGYWAGQGIVQAAFGHPFAQGGVYGGVPAGVNGGFGCAAGVGGSGFPGGPYGMAGPYGSGGPSYGLQYGNPFGSPYGAGAGGGGGAGYPQFGAGMYQPGQGPWGPAGMNVGGNFGSAYAAISPYGGGQFNGGQFGGGGPQFAGGPGSLIPYGYQQNGFNPAAFGAYPGVPGGGGPGYGYGPGGGIAQYNQYNPLGGAYSPAFGGYGGGGGSGGMNQYALQADAQQRNYFAQQAGGAAYSNLVNQFGLLNQNLSQLTSGFGAGGGYNASPYSVAPNSNSFNGGRTVLGVGNGGVFGPTPLGSPGGNTPFGSTFQNNSGPSTTTNRTR